MRPTAFLFAFASLLSACAPEDPAVVPVGPSPDDVSLASSGEHGRPGAIAERQGDLPLRHLRRRDLLDRHAAHARGHPDGGRPDDRALGRPQGGRRRAAGGGEGGHPERHGRPRRARRPRSRCSSSTRWSASTAQVDDAQDTLTRVGITCALCHSTVDNSFAPGIGQRLDGWPNRDLNVGAIIALSPGADAGAEGGLQLVGPGRSTIRASTSTA